MARARRNPIGLVLPKTQLVRVGNGQHTHILHPHYGVTICRLGRNPGVQGPATEPSPVYASQAKEVTCYRCVKLASKNIEEGRPPWKGPRDD